MSLKKIINTLLISGILVSSISCGDNKQDDILENDEVKVDESLNSKKISAQNVFNSLPGRTEIVDLSEKAKAEYNADILNNPENIGNYVTESNMALNLGIYGADLYVTGVFEQTQESFLFLQAVNILAKNLGVSNAFDEAIVDRMEANKENRDSTMSIITNSFKKIDNYLVENGRPGTSSLVVAGCWLESIYLACNTAKETKSEAIVKEIFMQKETLKYVIELLQNSKISEDAKFIIIDLINIKAVFDSKKDKNYSLESIKLVDQKITTLRSTIVKNK